ncbi:MULTISPECIES: sulfatase-like hydrolase/transferase [unclassified Haladaptatus]|uniref:sulfatase-like hydrolase/transferase n=1 Tax=unclassified Haladaptatus TaxID=2622732 RepID=UPI0023E827E6|nr:MULTISPECIES: sulfatase-like hydrolase/transferase [unclassified Haladaptatus]
MNVLFISIDSLSRHFLTCYGGRSVEFDVQTDNLDRFAERAAVFDSHYVGSLACMPARREWLTGVKDFLWRPWGPVEAYDVTLPRAAREADVLTQLVTDHYHYFQHGAHGYYEDFHGFEFIRGHEADAWRTAPRIPEDEALLRQTTDPDRWPADGLEYINRAQYARNVSRFDQTDEADFFAPKVFDFTARWLRENRDWDSWFTYVDSFDVHEPFHCPEPYASMYTEEDPRDPELTFWPHYGRVDEGLAELSGRELAFVRSQFAGKVTMVDRWFGRVLDALDEIEAWDDTMVVVTADHGHYLGEHGWIGKPRAPLYDVIARTPLLVWYPDGAHNGERVDALTTAVDLYATILDALDAPIRAHAHSRSFHPLLTGARDAHRDWALYGYWGSSVNVTDGRYTYFHPCDESVDAVCHSTSMMNPRGNFKPLDPKQDAESGQFLSFTDCPVWRYSGPSFARQDTPMLFDTQRDPEQTTDLVGTDSATESRMRSLLNEALAELNVPENQYRRLGLDIPN